MMLNSSRISGLFKRNSIWVLLILPALLIYTLFMAYPLLSSTVLSFFSDSGEYETSTFVGFDNYTKLFSDPNYSERFFGAFGNTWYFFFIHMMVQNVLGLIFALMLSSAFLKGKNVYRTMIFIPATLAVLVVGFIWKKILTPNIGALAQILEGLGLDSLSQDWLGDKKFALTTVSLVSSWQWVGMPTMIFLAGLEAIPEEYYEAASIDGASRWTVFWKIKLPLIRPVLGIVTILTFVNNFNAFDVVYAMKNADGAPGYSTDVLGTLFYRVGLAGEHPVGIPDRGMGATIAAITFIVLLVGVQLVQKFTKTGVGGNSEN